MAARYTSANFTPQGSPGLPDGMRLDVMWTDTSTPKRITVARAVELANAKGHMPYRATLVPPAYDLAPSSPQVVLDGVWTAVAVAAVFWLLTGRR